MIRPDAGRLFRSRPGPSRWQNPLAEKDGQPGVVFRWMEVEGPLKEETQAAGYHRLFGDLPMKRLGEGETAGVALEVAAPALASGQRGGFGGRGGGDGTGARGTNVTTGVRGGRGARGRGDGRRVSPHGLPHNPPPRSISNPWRIFRWH